MKSRRPRSAFRFQLRPSGFLYAGPESPDPEPGYMRLLDELPRTHPELLEPGVRHVVVWHDEDCRHPQGEPCTCKPTVELVEEPPR